MPNQQLAVASAKSFGDFVIAHSILHRVADGAKDRVRLISCSHVAPLNAVLPDTVCVTLVNSGGERVPALFDMKKRGLLAAAQSALSLRREFDRINRNRNEALTFEPLGVRERFIAGDWRLTKPRQKGSNVYDTYLELLREHEIRTVPRPPESTAIARSVGIFPESRLARKRLSAATLTIILERAAFAGLDAKLFILEGDATSAPRGSRTISIARNFQSLTEAIGSVDKIVSADSLPAHLGEYLARPVYVACPAPNEYWLPHRCFQEKRWGNFNKPPEFSNSLDRFLSAQAAGSLQ
jgi:hypothetical protein